MGPQGFCAGAIDDTGVQSNPWCITFLVGYSAPNLQKPLFVQHSASPLGTIFANHSIFAIQSEIFNVIHTTMQEYALDYSHRC